MKEIEEDVKLNFNFYKNRHPIYNSPTWSIYGPYQAKKDLRRRVIAYDGNKRITISYPKFLMECILGRKLLSNEEVHHKNRIEFDDRLDNLEIKEKVLHKSEHRQNLPQSFTCPVCKTFFTLEGKKLSNFKGNKKRNPNMKGPYCTKNCAGKENN